MSRPSDPASPAAGRPVASLPAYAVAVGATVVAILSQYFLPELLPATRPAYASLAGSLLIVYGLPVLAFALLVGWGPLRGYVAGMRTATVEGLRWYGALSVLGLLVVFLLEIVYLAVDPSALRLLDRETPVIEAARSNPWFWVGFSFVIGLVEETIFRGWLFGYWLVRSPDRWFVHAVWTSGLFAGLHLYYGNTYGPVSTFASTELFFAGLAFAVAVRYSNGNVLVVGLLHGVHDAAAFLTLVSEPAGLALYYLVILAGAAIALALYLRDRAPSPAPPPPAPPPGSPAYGPAHGPGYEGNPAIVFPRPAPSPGLPPAGGPSPPLPAGPPPAP